MSEFINLTEGNLEKEHVCCAIADKKHQPGVANKKKWLKERIAEGHVFRKLDAKGKVFIEYAPLEKAWVPIQGENYFYVYCLWVAGSWKGHGYASELMEYCIKDAREQGKAGICVLSARKKKPFLSEKSFFLKYGFEVVDTVGDEYELLALSFQGQKPSFMDNARTMTIENKELTVYYGMQCPFILNSVEQIKEYCENHQLPYKLIPVDTLEKAKRVPCVFNNWAVFYQGKYDTNHLLNDTMLKKKFEQ